MSEISRRTIIRGTVALAMAPLIPALPGLPMPPLKAFIVGTAGDYNWRHYLAATAEQARRYWAEEEVGECEETPPDQPDCECETCSTFLSTEAQAVPEWDTIDHFPSAGDWVRAGIGHICDRCGYEGHPNNGMIAIGDDAVCEDCQTPAESGDDVDVAE